MLPSSHSHSSSVSYNQQMAEQAPPAELGVPHTLHAPPPTIMDLQRSLSVDYSAPQTIQQFTPEENQFILAAIEAYQAKSTAPSKNVSFQMQQHLMRKLQTGSMSTKPKPKKSRTSRQPSKLRHRINAPGKTHKRKSNSNNSPLPGLPFPGLNSLNSSENAIEMRI